jgi:TP901 family phage tail tape measure protein
MSEFNLGTARGVIEIDYTGKPAVDAATEDIQGLEKSTGKMDPAIAKVGTAALVAGSAIAGGFALAVRSAASFEKGLDGIQAVSGATTGEMDKVREKALQLGRDTAFSAGESATAMEELVKAGISIPDVLNGAADATVALAAAGGVELPAAATIASNAMNQFGLSAAEMPKVADLIAGAANSSAIDVNEFGQSLAQVGAVANLTGLSFDDTAVAIAAMGNAGIKGSDAGTSLKTMLTNLQPTTEKQIELFKKLGIVTADGGNQFYDATGKIKPMNEIAGVLAKSLEGMSDAQKTAALETMFGSDAIRAAAVIADTGAAGFDKLAGAMAKTSAADVAATRMDNFSGKMEEFKGSVETMAIQVGSMLLPALTQIAEKVTAVVNWFSQLDSGTQRTIVTIIGIVGAVLLAVGALIKIVQFVQAAKAAFIALNAVMAFNPFILIVAAIIGLILLIKHLWENNETFKAKVLEVWAAVKNAIMTVVNYITGTVVPFWVNAWNTLVAAAQAFWAKTVSIWNGIRDAISTAWNAIKNVIATVWNFIVALITGYINMILTIIRTVMNVILAVWNGIWGLFGPLVKAIWDLIKAIVQVAVAWIVTIIRTYLNMLIGFWRAVWNGIKAVATTVWNAIRSVVQAGINRINAIVRAVMNTIRSIWNSVWNTIKSIAQRVWASIYSAISGPLNRARALVSSVVNAIRSAITSGFNAAKSAATNAFNGLRNAVTSAINTAKQRVQSAISAIKGYFSGAGSWLYSAGKKIIQGLINGIKALVGSVTSAISGIASKIRSFLPGSPIKVGPLKDAGWNTGEPGKKLVSWLAEGIGSEEDAITKAFANLPTEVPISLTAPDVALAGSASRTGTRGMRAAPATPTPTSRALPPVEVHNHYPVREKGSQAAVKGMTRLVSLGLFDSGEDDRQ